MDGYVAVIYDDTWYPGMVKEIVGDECTISFMKQMGNNSFIWPLAADIDHMSKSGIFTCLPAPTPVSRRHFSFDADFLGSVTAQVRSYLQEHKYV